jgi:hypothetical protein
MKTIILSIFAAIVLLTNVHAQYTVTSIPYNPYSYNSGTPVLVNIDDTWSNLIQLPFTFNFYGNNYTQIIIGSNGLITFDLTQAGSYCPWSYTASIPSSSIPMNAIYCPYHDIDPSITGDIYYATYGLAPNREFVVSFNAIAMFSSSCNSLLATQEVVLYESTNIIDVFIQNAPLCSSWNSGNKCIGIQDATASSASIAAPGRNTGAWSATNEAWRFYQGQIALTVYVNNVTNASCNTNNGSINTGVLGGTSPYTFLWNTLPPQTSPTLINVPAGTYCVTVTDASGDTSTTCATVDSINPIPGFDLGNDTSFCQYDSIIIQLPNLFDTYQWSTGDTTVQISVGAEDMYYITVTSACGGSASDSIYISMSQLPTADAGPSDTICSGATDTLTASGGSSYHWNTGANIQFLVVDPLVTTTYYVTVTNTSGCIATDSVLIVVLPAMSASTTQIDATCGLNNGSSSVNVSGGSGSFSYQWNTSPPQYSSTAINLSPGTYSVTVTDLSTGCIIMKTVTISNIPAPSVSIQNIVNANCNENNGSITTNITGGTSPYNYLWNSIPPQSGPTLTNVLPDYYCVTVTDGNGCTATVCGTVQVVAYSEPDICMVSVDTSDNFNLVIWEKQATTGIDKYYIYRETSVSGIYNLIGTQNYSDLSTFIDSTSNSLQQPYRYKLAIYDFCGLTSDQSNYHQTIHLTINAGMSGEWNLIWNDYEGFSLSTYNIYRGTSSANMTLLNSVSSTVNSYTDLTPPAGTVYYLVEAVKQTPCSPSVKSKSTINSTISNIANTDVVGINEFSEEGNILIYPNPVSGIFTILFSDNMNEPVSVEVLNSIGQLVYSDIMNTNPKNIDVSELSKGIYSLKLTTAEKSYFKKIVIE